MSVSNQATTPGLEGIKEALARTEEAVSNTKAFSAISEQ
jgi:hypothetical protein